MSKCPFFTQYDTGVAEATPHGDNTQEAVFSERINEHGEYEVYQSGTYNL